MASAAVLAAEDHWRAARARRRRGLLLGGLTFLAAVLAAGWVGEVSLTRLGRGLPLAWDYVSRTLPPLHAQTLGADLADWMWGFPDWLALLGDTLLIAYAGTVLGAAAGLLLSFPAAATLAPPWAVAAARRFLEFARTVPTLVLALVFVYAFGLGAFAGMLAIALHTAGALGKLFAEEHENAALGPVEAVRATGGAWAAQMRFGVLPQSLPGMLSLGLLRFEINVREASVLGIVGAGGIGEELYLAVRQFEYQDISAILVLILATVSAIDLLCGALRRRALGARTA
ncbi:phosphonate ABC transporter, permease protein PhnE [Roseomonas eburnea]|uniref:Phosphonate ABC transporter, permease protein PhnE n=1 Tax=Neoroseomonas eburnea TaxID=1346889 RepID=A0A9X9X9K2_9PROT|nr:phosphonate ABC transporter, permease protein PhnE [Neoroseomonas eburnea]MBR0680388.1 phosphonate ABC transporter, permease protein PhnE [Neoroseomonas eburnea]